MVPSREVTHDAAAESVVFYFLFLLAEELLLTSNFNHSTYFEIPRAALTADRIASSAEFFSFGTNDLTQMTFGYSRDDIASFLPVYLEKKILKVDPFQVLDQKDRKSTRLNSSHIIPSRMPSSA